MRAQRRDEWVLTLTITNEEAVLLRDAIAVLSPETPVAQAQASLMLAEFERALERKW